MVEAAKVIPFRTKKSAKAKAREAAYQKEWRKKNREHANAYMREYRKRRPEATRAAGRRWVEKNQDKHQAYAVAHRRANPERYRAAARQWLAKQSPQELKRIQRSRALKHLYGLTVDDWNALLRKQKGCCALCGRIFLPKETPFVDHNHQTSRVRGLIHAKCNFLLGNAEDDVELLKKAVKYLRKHQE